MPFLPLGRLFWKGGDGAIPVNSTLIFDSKGALYGTTSHGGIAGCGVVAGADAAVDSASLATAAARCTISAGVAP